MEFGIFQLQAPGNPANSIESGMKVELYRRTWPSWENM